MVNFVMINFNFEKVLCLLEIIRLCYIFALACYTVGPGRARKTLGRGNSSGQVTIIPNEEMPGKQVLSNSISNRIQCGFFDV